MGKQNERRSFLKYMVSLSAFVAGSSLSFNKDKGPEIGKLSRAEAQGTGSAGKRVKKIAVEEHCFTKEYVDWLYSSRTDHVSENAMFRQRSPDHPFVLKAVDLGEGRLKEMDEAGIDMQILSLSYPDLEPFKTADAIALSKIVNDGFSETIKQYPDRFSAYCCIPFNHDPEAAADELERAVTKLGLRGTMVNDSTEITFSDRKYEVIYERLSKLKVPIYIHHTGAGEGLVPDIINLISGDLLDKYPNLQFMLGHAGESIPFWLWRRSRSESRDGKRSFKQKFQEHFHVTTSDQCSDVLLQFLIAAIGADRIMFSTDYPYESTKKHADWIDSAPISDSDREKICHLNAEKLFRL